jgi:hypothetical protein
VQLSVIVGIVDGGAQLERCLAALAAQVMAPEMEVIVPWDDSVEGMQAFAVRYPSFTFPAMGRVDTLYPPTSHAGLHELYDKRRAVGLHAATGDLVAILEDRSVPEMEWARAAVKAHAERPNGVIGGAIASGRRTVLGFADYLCDFYRYQPPLDAGPREYVSNVNICYKRSALERTKSLWAEAYYDLTVHWALQRDGEVLWLDPRMLVKQMRGDGERLGTLLSERLAWGRRFAVRRSSEVSGVGRLRYALQSPLVPLVLYSRVARGYHGRTLDLLMATPAMLVIFAAWGLGEFVGYATGRQ